MLFLIALAYLLLCVRIHVRLEASFENGWGGAALGVGALGLRVRRDYVLVRGENLFSLRLKSVRGKARRRKKKSASSRFASRLVKQILMDALRGGRFECIALRLSLGDACETAIAAGAVRAILCALLAGMGDLRRCALSITPDFDRSGLYAQAVGIFSCQPGDIMLAALKAALGKRARRLKWTSIPLRA